MLSVFKQESEQVRSVWCTCHSTRLHYFKIRENLKHNFNEPQWTNMVESFGLNWEKDQYLSNIYELISAQWAFQSLLKKFMKISPCATWGAPQLCHLSCVAFVSRFHLGRPWPREVEANRGASHAHADWAADRRQRGGTRHSCLDSGQGVRDAAWRGHQRELPQSPPDGTHQRAGGWASCCQQHLLGRFTLLLALGVKENGVFWGDVHEDVPNWVKINRWVRLVKSQLVRLSASFLPAQLDIFVLSALYENTTWFVFFCFCHLNMHVDLFSFCRNSMRKIRLTLFRLAPKYQKQVFSVNCAHRHAPSLLGLFQFSRGCLWECRHCRWNFRARNLLLVNLLWNHGTEVTGNNRQVSWP